MNQFIRSFAVIGGDQRQSFLAKALGRNGYAVKCFGFGRISGEREEEDPLSAVRDADAVILPIPYSADGISIPTPLSAASSSLKIVSLLDAMKKDSVLFGGKLDEDFLRCCSFHSIRAFDYLESETLAIENAAATAEGAVAIALETLPVTLYKVSAVVLGYGRIGRTLASKLHVLGADVLVCARSESARAYAKAEGMQACTFEELPELIGNVRIVFNTVPAQIVGEPLLRSSRSDCVWIDLASKPGGIDRAAPGYSERMIISALSLPGRFSPESAGEYLANSIIRIVKRRESACSDLQ